MFICANCKKIFKVSRGRLNRALKDPINFTPKACSMRCNKIRLIGKRRSIKTEFNRGRTLGENNNKWKGDSVGYYGVHDWIKYHYGSPLKCEQCGFESERSMQFNWANISKRYKRDRSDWLRLCRKCHHKYDDISGKSWKTRKANHAKIKS